MATSDSTANIIPDMPPWMLDHVAAMRKDEARTPVNRPTTIPDKIDAMRRPMSLFSAGTFALRLELRELGLPLPIP